MPQITLLIIFAVVGGVFLFGYIFSRWISWRFNKKKPALKGLMGVIENGMHKLTWESTDGPRIITAVIAYLVFLAFLSYVTFNDLPQFLDWLG